LHSNLTSLREETPIYLGELEEALKSNPDTRFVLAHAGTSGG
ncbi:MAG TPA: 5-oxo-L-prolinase, partial [Alcanivorax sp.]|nr:5-oxo-L-prolinase [Alcanivorax sp.]